MLITFLRVFSAAAVCVLAACGGNGKTDSLNIDREYRSPQLRTDIRDAEFVEKLTWESSTEELEDGFLRKVFPIPPGLAFSMLSVDTSGSSDPFAVPATPHGIPKVGFREVLEIAGILFSDGSSVHYDDEKWILVVVNTPEQMELVDAYLTSINYDEETRVFVRAEIYEVSHLHALQLADSASHESEHTPEREAVLHAVKAGTAKLVSAPSVIGRSGQRSKVEVTSRSDFNVGASPEEGSGKDERFSNAFASRFEVDSVLGADGYTIDLSFSLEHPIPIDSAGADSVPIAEGGSFRQASINSMVTLTHGSHVLVGSWDSGEDSVLMVFLTATHQDLADLRPMIKVAPLQK